METAWKKRHRLKIEKRKKQADTPTKPSRTEDKIEPERSLSGPLFKSLSHGQGLSHRPKH